MYILVDYAEVMSTSGSALESMSVQAQSIDPVNPLSAQEILRYRYEMNSQTG